MIEENILKKWLEQQKDPDQETIPGPITGYYSPREVVDSIKRGMPVGHYFAFGIFQHQHNQ